MCRETTMKPNKDEMIMLLEKEVEGLKEENEKLYALIGKKEVKVTNLQEVAEKLIMKAEPGLEALLDDLASNIAKDLYTQDKTGEESVLGDLAASVFEEMKEKGEII